MQIVVCKLFPDAEKVTDGHCRESESRTWNQVARAEREAVARRAAR